MSWELCGSIFVIVHAEANPTDAEYDDALGGYGQHYGKFRGILIQSEGGAPSSLQRKRTTDFWQGKELPRTAIMTGSTIVRGAVTAFNWFFPERRLMAYGFTDFQSTLAYLGADPLDRVPVERTVARLRERLREGVSVAG